MRYNDLVDDYLNNKTRRTETYRSNDDKRESEGYKTRSSPKLRDANGRPKAGGFQKFFEFNGHPKECP